MTHLHMCTVKTPLIISFLSAKLLKIISRAYKVELHDKIPYPAFTSSLNYVAHFHYMLSHCFTSCFISHKLSIHCCDRTLKSRLGLVFNLTGSIAYRELSKDVTKAK